MSDPSEPVQPGHPVQPDEPVRPEDAAPASGRAEQLAYSDSMAKMLDETGRRQKAAKIVAVVRHALGVDDLSGLAAVDVGCSAGFIADELALAGARTTGVDIDEPGLEKARARFGERVDFRVARGEDLPLPDGSADVVVLNHIYEHVVDPEAVVADIHRVLRPGGLLYLGVGHRWQVVEPHHRLPFLSWLPRPAADRYMRLTRKGEEYYERYYTPGGLRRLFAAYDVWDYTLPVLADPGAFAAGDTVPAWAERVPERVLAAALPLVPTYVWAAFKGASTPAGPPLKVAPRHLV
ncbi:class I SAM-dependent methyltransferase [Phycicoccus sp. BSK3Z-2]|uniref:Class I SAM-dependent methyltransferase n=1 Tax=Phycicoccus avicenniae TaxID=2828860 RepID=A0A941D8Q0_9MICO|nr:class I SAM-dependent methyltransferase [Phycicoccus avicenniae]MBR7743454.1 class I SAM-dependent methyltransferase [Phycicoccus avicenniae]MBR7743938.1 class I SAM-dependent methyltransferase [Phycicoccus avicenniae]